MGWITLVVVDGGCVDGFVVVVDDDDWSNYHSHDHHSHFDHHPHQIPISLYDIVLWRRRGGRFRWWRGQLVRLVERHCGV